MNAGGPSALANRAGEGLWRRGHDDGAHGGTPASLHALRLLTKCCQWARGEAMGCWGDGGAMAVVLEWLGASCARLWRRRSCKSSAAAAAGEKKTEAKQMGCAAECGRALGRLRRALAWLCHAGQGAGDARPWLATTRRTGSEPVGHRAGRFSSTEIEMGRLTAGFQVEQTLNPWTSSQNFLNQTCRPMY